MFRAIPLLVIGMVIINLLAVFFIGLIYSSINRDDGDTGEYFRIFNSYALMVSNTETHPTEEVYKQYVVLAEKYEIISRHLKKNTELPEPVYSNLKEREAYSTLLREHAIKVRTNRSFAVEHSYLIIGIMLGLVGVISLIILLTMLVTRKAMSSYASEITNGLNYIEKILTFRQEPYFQHEETRINEVQQLYEAISKLSNDISYNRKISNSAFYGNLDQIMSDLFENFKNRMPCDRVALAFIDSDDNCIAETAVTSFNNPHLEPGFRENMSKTSLVEVRASSNPRIINDLEEHANSRRVSAATHLILKEGLRSSITIPMIFEEKCLGFFFVSSRKKNAYDENTMQYVSRVINLMKQKFYTEYLLQEVISETANAFVGLMEEKDNETSAHILRMSQYSYITARAYHEEISPLKPRFMREILWFAPLHDIGKVGTPDAILLKEGPLAKTEMDTMKRHVETGLVVIKNMNEKLGKIVSSSLMKTAIDIISGHHEKFNGKGYPEGLSGDSIPLAGRIIAVADVFDALTSKRPYKDAFSIEEALRIMENDMVESFDPDVLKAFKSGLPEIRKVYDALKEV